MVPVTVTQCFVVYIFFFAASSVEPRPTPTAFTNHCEFVFDFYHR